jgi:hypothetical protein
VLSVWLADRVGGDNRTRDRDRAAKTVAVVTIDDVRELVDGLPRSYEAFVRGRVKFRVGQIVYLAFSRDETVMGFAFPKEEREALLQTYPEKFLPPDPVDVRYNWVQVRLDAIDRQELLELVFDAWRMVVPKKLASASDEELLQGLREP